MTSRLVGAHSAYLRSAAHQPVQWHPWGPEAFARARAEHKPILLDVGAVWCHWCHVMDEESYENAQTAELLNRDWVCIKVDRDERPDVDARYQRAVQALTGQGGWPLTAFLDADGDVFFGGTYFPPEASQGRPAFRSVLQELSRIYREQPDRVSEQAAQIRQHLERSAVDGRPGTPSERLLDDAVDAMRRTFDMRYGGFGSQPKFPHPGACELLLARWFDQRESWVREIVDRTLLGMARGGVYDQLAGGFHRYAVDARWIVPHFEKMSYDNSELLRVYLHAAASWAPTAREGHMPPDESSRTPVVEYHRVAHGIADWVLEVLARPEGGYGASQDADVGPGDDGDYFTWTPDEARAVTTAEEFQVLARHYDIDDAGEMHHNPQKNVLWVRQSAAEIAAGTGASVDEVAGRLASGRAKLRAARRLRTAPFVDTTVYTGWSAMMTSAMLEAAAHLDRPDLERHALLTLERLFREGPLNGTPELRHALGGDVPGVLDDQVLAVAAALDGFEVTGQRRWLDRASALMHYVWLAYGAEDDGLYDRPSSRGGEGFLTQRLKPVQDAPTPSGNGVAALVCARLSAHADEQESQVWRARLEAMLSAFAGDAAPLSWYTATLLRAMDWLLHPVAQAVIVGAADDPRAAALLAQARRAYRPRLVIRRLEPGAPPSQFPPALRAMLDAATPRAYVCAGTECAPPTAEPDVLSETLARFGVPGLR